MKLNNRILLVFGLLTLSTIAQARSLGPTLIKEVGSVASNDKDEETTCVVYSDRTLFDYVENGQKYGFEVKGGYTGEGYSKNDISNILQNIRINKMKIVHVYNRANVPDIKISGTNLRHQGGRTEKILLMHDYGDKRAREGSDDLVDLTEKLCDAAATAAKKDADSGIED